MSETNKAPAVKSAADADQPLYYWGTGRRKRAVARVRLKPGSGQLVINKKRTIEDYFVRDQDKLIMLAPLRVTGTKTKFDVFINVDGGGSTGQAGAVAMGIARALVKADAANHAALRAGGFLTRDAREVERKKPGQAGARRSFQFSKR